MSNQLISFYIPRIPININKKTLNKIFENVGLISRVDFTPINKKPGFKENIEGEYRSVFIHFQKFYTDDELLVKLLVNNILETLEKGHSYKFYSNYVDGFLLLLKNKNPFNDTWMNKHQIVENCRLLEDKIEKQEETIKELENKLNGVHKVTTELIGGLFNQWEQQKTIYSHMGSLGFKSTTNQKNKNSESNGIWDIWPTTRQGDANEAKINILETQMKFLIEQIYCLTGEIPNYEDKILYNKKISKNFIEENKDTNRSTWFKNNK